MHWTRGLRAVHCGAVALSIAACGASPSTTPLDATVPRNPRSALPREDAVAQLDLPAVGIIPSPTTAWERWRDLAAATDPEVGAMELSMLASAALGPPLASGIDWDRPIVLGLPDDDEPVFAAHAIPFDRAAEIWADAGAERRGVRWALTIPYDGDDPPNRCELWPQLDERPALVVCSEQEQIDLRAYAMALGPALTRPTAADRDIEIVMLSATIHDALAEDDEPPASEAEALGRQIVVDAFDDIQEIAFGLTRQAGNIRASLDFVFAESSSLFSSMLLGEGNDPGAPAALFARLPSDATITVSARGSARTRSNLAFFQVFADAMAAEPEGTEAEREALTRVLSSSLLTGGAWALAHGISLEGAESALARAAATDSLVAAAPKIEAAAKRWYVAGLVTPPETLSDGIRELVELDAQHGGQAKATVMPLPVDRFGLPDGTLHVVLDSGPAPSDDWEEASLSSTPGSCRGVSPSLEADARGGACASPGTSTSTHLFVVPDGDLTWLGMADDRDAIVGRLRTIVASRPAAVPGPGVPDLSFTGAFVPAALPFAVPLSASDSLEDLHDAVRAIRMTPGGGRDRIFFEVRRVVQVKTGNDVARLSMQLPEDFVIALLVQLADE